jgi:hypothetical protein
MSDVVVDLGEKEASPASPSTDSSGEVLRGDLSRRPSAQPNQQAAATDAELDINPSVPNADGKKEGEKVDGKGDVAVENGGHRGQQGNDPCSPGALNHA